VTRLKILLGRGVKSVWGEDAHGLATPVLVEDNVAIVFDEAALSEGAVKCAEGVGGIVVVVIFKNLLDCFGDVWLVVEGNGREEMMGDVVMRDVVEEEATCPAKQWSVDGRNSSAQEGPLLVAVVSNSRVGVMEVSQHDDPVVGQEIRNEVELEEIPESNLLGPQVESRGHDAQTDVRCDDSVALMGLEERRRWLEVVGAGRIHRGAHDVGQEIILPAESLHEEHTTESIDGGLLKDFMIVRDMCARLRRKAIVGTGAGDEVLVSFDGHGGFVMSMMGRSPGIVGNEDKCVH